MTHHTRTVRYATLMCIAAGACATDGDDVTWRRGLEVGGYPVGFRSQEITREVADGDPRSLTLSVWYPASPTGGDDPPMIFEDLFSIALDEGQLLETRGLSIEGGIAAAMTGDSTSLPFDRARALLDAATLARRDAPPAVGRFPLALWSVRHATVVAQAPMAEVLASHGMVVATVWSSDPPLAFLWEDRSEADKLTTIEAHTQDLQHALAVLRADSAVDGERVVVLSWSYGGQTAARLQERDDAVRAVIGLDANVLPARPEERPALRRHLVYLVGEGTTSRGLERLEDLTAPWVAVRFPELAHGNFNALEGYLPGVYEADTVFAWSRGGEVARQGYRVLVRMVTEVVTTFSAATSPSMTALAGRLQRVAGSLAAEVRHSDAGRDD